MAQNVEPGRSHQIHQQENDHCAREENVHFLTKPVFLFALLALFFEGCRYAATAIGCVAVLSWARAGAEASDVGAATVSTRPSQPFRERILGLEWR